MTPADIEQCIDIRKLALDTSALKIPTGGEGLEPEQIEDFVNGFFDALDDVKEYCDEEIDDDGMGERSSDEEVSAFFFQAEDGIRDLYVTGVQTCALPISVANSTASSERSDLGSACTTVTVGRGAAMSARSVTRADSRPLAVSSTTQCASTPDRKSVV